MVTRTVGPGGTYSTIGAAFTAASSGDIISVNPAGNPYNLANGISVTKNLDFVSSVPGVFVQIITGSYVSNDKAPILSNANVTFTWFEWTSIIGPSNVAAIRFESGNLTLTNCYIHDFPGDGILAGEGNGTGTLTNCEFSHLGNGDSLTHCCYFGKQNTVIVNNCYFHHCDYGNVFKCRALNTTLSNSRFFDDTAASNWECDFPNGGVVQMTNCVIQQSANPSNKSIMDVGAERDNTNPAYGIYTPSSLNCQGCTIVNDCTDGAFMLVNNFGIAPITFNNTKIYDVSHVMGSIPSGMTNTTNLSTRPTLDTSHPWSTGPVISPAQGAASGVTSVTAISSYTPPSTAIFRSETEVPPNQTGGQTSFVEDSTVAPYAARTNSVFSKPVGTITGHQLIMFLFVGAQGGTAVTRPTGFLDVGTQPAATYTDGAGFAGNLYVWYKNAGGSEPSTYTATHASASTEGQLYSVAGTDGSMPKIVSAAGTGATVTTGSLTLNSSGAFVMNVMFCWTDATGTPPTNYTERFDPGSGTILYAADRVYPVAGATGAVSSNHPSNTDIWRSVLVATEASPSVAVPRTNTVFSRPPSVIAGDTLVLLMVIGAQGTLPTVTPPAGFANIHQTNGNPITTFSDGTNYIRGLYAWYKVAGSSEPATYTVTHTSATTEGEMYCVAGGDGQLPKIVLTSGSGTSAVTGSLTMANANSFLIEAVMASTDASGTPPANFTERYDP